MDERNELAAWIAPEIDFEELFQGKQYDKLICLAEENINLIRKLSVGSSADDLLRSVNLGISILSYFERSIQQSKDFLSLFLLGKLKGRLETLNEQHYNLQQDNIAEATGQMAYTKYLDQIVSLLEMWGSMTQSELCERLDLQKSTLSEALKKVRETQLVAVHSMGKYKVYSLTDEGIRYGALQRKNKKKSLNVEDTLDALQKQLSQEESRDAIVQGLKRLLRENGSIILESGNTFQIMDREQRTKQKFCLEQTLELRNQRNNSRLDVLVCAKEKEYDRKRINSEVKNIS